MEEEQDVIEDIENTSEEADLETADESTEDQGESQDDSGDSQGEETVDQLKERLAKAEEKAENQRIRAEKAERKVKAPKPEPAPQKNELSQVDLIALIKADVTEADDIAEVTDYAKLKGISVGEALKSSVIKTVLAERAENRKVSAATNTGTSKRTTGKVSDETLLSNAKKGELPDSDEDMQRLVGAHLGANKK